MVSRWSSVCPSVRLPYVCPSVVSFPDDNFSKRQWSVTKLGMCIDIMKIWFWIADGQSSSFFFIVHLHETRPYFPFRAIHVT